MEVAVGAAEAAEAAVKVLVAGDEEVKAAAEEEDDEAKAVELLLLAENDDDDEEEEDDDDEEERAPRRLRLPPAWAWPDERSITQPSNTAPTLSSTTSAPRAPIQNGCHSPVRSLSQRE